MPACASTRHNTSTQRHMMHTRTVCCASSCHALMHHSRLENIWWSCFRWRSSIEGCAIGTVVHDRVCVPAPTRGTDIGRSDSPAVCCSIYMNHFELLCSTEWGATWHEIMLILLGTDWKQLDWSWKNQVESSLIKCSGNPQFSRSKWPSPSTPSVWGAPSENPSNPSTYLGKY